MASEDSTATSAGVQDPEIQLEAMKKDFETKQAEADRLTKENAALKTSISTLEKSVEELRKAQDAYKKSASGYETDKGDLVTYLNNKTKMVLAALGTGKDDVDKKIKAVDDDLATRETTIGKLKVAAEAAGKAAAAAQAKVTEKKAAFEDLKNVQKLIEDRIKNLKAMRASIEQEDDKNNVTGMYFLLQELDAQLKDLNLPKGDELKDQLNSASLALKNASSDAATAQDTLDKAKADLDTADKALQSDRAKRRATILSAVTG